MHSITLLATKLQTDFPMYHFTEGDAFRWSPQEKTVYYNHASHDQSSLLHEVSHAILNHTEYLKDIELIEMERAAWEYAQQSLGRQYGVVIEDETIQQSLDTYRDWLHARSTCPHCSATGIQAKKRRYKCIACTTSWHVNDARICALRRYTVK